MADLTIAAVGTLKSSLAGTELVEIQDGATSKRTTAAAIADLAPAPAFSEVTSTPTTLAGYGITDAASSAQGALAASAVQPGDLATVATSGLYSDLTGTPTLGTAAAAATTDFATAAQGALAATAIQPADLGAAATTNDYADLDNLPTLGTAAAQPTSAFATAAQGALATTAVQPGDLAAIATSGDLADLGGFPGGTTTFWRADGTFAVPAAPAWGSITGTLSSQTDLQSAINTAADTATWGSISGTLGSQSDLASVLNAKAPLSGPNLTGVPTAPTASFGGNSTQLATTAFVQAAISRISVQSKSADYTGVLADAGSMLYHPASDANARTFTIPANASVAYPTGTVLVFLNMSANDLSIAITSDAMNLIGDGSTGTRTLAQYGYAVATKIGTTSWIIAGTGLT